MLAPVPSRKAPAAASSQRSSSHPFSVLDQATAGFAAEAGELASFERMPHAGGQGGGKKGGGRKAVLSTRARQRRVAGAEKEEAYHDRLTGRVARQNRRKERMELLKKRY